MVVAAVACSACGQVEGHHRTCPQWARDDAGRQARVRAVDELREARATGRRRFKNAAHALRWFAQTRTAWSSARGLPLDPEREGNGTPNRGADDPKRAAYAAVAYAAKLAALDDAERHPRRRAPVDVWLRLHFDGRGRNHGFSYEHLAEDTPGAWSGPEVQARMERIVRLVRDRLRAGGWLDAG